MAGDLDCAGIQSSAAREEKTKPEKQLRVEVEKAYMFSTQIFYPPITPGTPQCTRSKMTIVDNRTRTQHQQMRGKIGKMGQMWQVKYSPNCFLL